MPAERVLPLPLHLPLFALPGPLLLAVVLLAQPPHVSRCPVQNCVRIPTTRAAVAPTAAATTGIHGLAVAVAVVPPAFILESSDARSSHANGLPALGSCTHSRDRLSRMYACSNHVVDVRLPDWGDYPAQCEHGHLRGPERVIVSWRPCRCGPALAAAQGRGPAAIRRSSTGPRAAGRSGGPA
jgi:hypothetical protein